MRAMGPIGKGPLLHLLARGEEFDARIITVVAIYSAVGIRDAHEESPSCWLHASGFCFSA